MARATIETPLADLLGQPLDAEFDEVIDSDPIPFLQAIEPIAKTGLIHKCKERAEVTKAEATRWKLNHGCALTVDGIAAIQKYCAEDSKPSFYSLLNRCCYDRDRSSLGPWIPYMWLLIKTLWQLEPYAGSMVYRGVKLNLRAEYVARKAQERHVTFWSFTSTTKTEEALKDEKFLGETGARTLFVIQLTQRQARDISPFSPLQEAEVLLPPCSQFEIAAVIAQGDLTIISLVEVKSKHWIVGMAVQHIADSYKRAEGSVAKTEEKSDAAAKAFLAAERFEGARPGYAFKVGPHGLGYYCDTGTKGQVHTPSKSVQCEVEVTTPGSTEACKGEYHLGTGSASAKTFVAAKTFEGDRPGHTFKVGPHGLGYYWDTGSAMEVHVAPIGCTSQESLQGPRSTAVISPRTTAACKGEELREGFQGKSHSSDSILDRYFVPEKSFKGDRPGYAFGMGYLGLGYYLDAGDAWRAVFGELPG